MLRVEPSSPEPSVVGRIEDREDAKTNMAQKANGGGLVFTTSGDLLIASGPFGEVVRLRATELDEANPGVAQTFITGVQGANALVIDGTNVYVSGGNTGNIYRAPVSGGEAAVWAQIPASTRSVPPDGFMQSVVANGLALTSGRRATRGRHGKRRDLGNCRSCEWRGWHSSNGCSEPNARRGGRHRVRFARDVVGGRERAQFALRRQ